MQKPRFLAIILLAACTGNVSSQAVFGSFGGEALSGFSPGLLNRKPNYRFLQISHGIGHDIRAVFP